MNFEICTMNIQSAQAADRAGAARIELCTALSVGGLTPSAGLILETVNIITIPVHVLIRPREGDFCYSPTEVSLMARDIRFCAEAGAAGVVIGALTPDGRLDIAALEAMKTAAGNMDLTLHRAFDYTQDPFATLEQLIEMGFKRVLSSGGEAHAWEGRELLKQLVERAAGRIAVMPGSGVNADNIAALLQFTGARDIHFTARKTVKGASGDEIPGLEADHWESDEATILKTIAAADAG